MPTAEERAAALKASQEHWRKNLAAETPAKVKIGVGSCALCGLFSGCAECPVMNETGESECFGSPYYRAADALHAWRADPTNPDLKAKWRAAALAECEFLESLK
jgi:hypothetical protein